MRKFAAGILSAFFLTLCSCATQPDAVRDIPEYSDALVQKISDKIESEEYSDAVYLCRTIGDDRISGLEKQALTGLENSLVDAIEDERYFEAAEYRKSLTAAGVDFNRTLEEIYLLEVIKEIDNDSIVPALALFEQASELNEKIELSDEQFAEILDAAVEVNDKRTLKYLIERSPESCEERKDEIDAVFDYVPDKSEMISGTVTIWVNRGIKIEQGVGYADRVIGSGFYIDSRGYVLTNYHVISSEVDPEYEGYSRLYIKYDKNEEKIPATVVGWDASLDIALLKVAFTPEYVYSLSSSREYKPGDKIYAIGSPGGLDKTITSGIVSASGNRRLLPLGDTIQVDVPINSGNSGGPVVDNEGNLAGVVFAGIEQFEGVNFIIPAEWVIESLPELFTEGRNRLSWLGFTVHESREGLEVIYVKPNTSGFYAGVQQGDRLVSINGVRIMEIPEAQKEVIFNRPGTLLDVEIMRGEELMHFLLKAEEREDAPMKDAIHLDSRKNLTAPFLGMAVVPGNDEVIGQEYIIKKIYRGMAAAETGLSVDDPFSIVSWEIDEENDVLYVGIRIKKRKAGFLETVIQLGSYIDINNTL